MTPSLIMMIVGQVRSYYSC